MAETAWFTYDDFADRVGEQFRVRLPETHELELAEVLAALPAHDVRVEDRGFDVEDAEYADIVRRVIRDEIGRGEGANFVIRRTFRGELNGGGSALFRFKTFSGSAEIRR